jgi:hypothetical protein
VTRTTSTTNAWEYSVELTVGGEAGGYSAELTVGFTQSSSSTKTASFTEEKEETIAVSESHSVTLKTGNYRITAACDIIEVQPTVLTFPATKTYGFKVRDSFQVGTLYLWERRENTTLTVAGNMRSASMLTTKKTGLIKLLRSGVSYHIAK